MKSTPRIAVCRALILAIALASVAACKNEQDLKAGTEQLCSAMERARKDSRWNDNDAAIKAHVIGELLTDGVTNPEVLEWAGRVGDMDRETKRISLKALTARAGVEECELLGLFEPIASK